MGSQTADQPLDEDLEDSRRDQAVEEADDSIIEIPKGANADLHEKHDRDGNHGGEEGGKPNGDDVLAERVGNLGVDDLAIGEDDGERPGGRWLGEVNLESSSLVWGGANKTEHLRTPSPTAPRTTIVRRSSQVALSHWPKLGRVAMVYGAAVWRPRARFSLATGAGPFRERRPRKPMMSRLAAVPSAGSVKWRVRKRFSGGWVAMSLQCQELEERRRVLVGVFCARL